MSQALTVFVHIVKRVVVAAPATSEAAICIGKL